MKKRKFTVIILLLFLGFCKANYENLMKDAMEEKSKGHYVKSFELLKKAAVLKPTAEVYKEIANIYIEYYHNYDQAENTLNEALSVNPDYKNAIHNMGLIYIKRYENSLEKTPNPEYLDKAEEWLQKNIKNHPEFGLSFAEYGMVKFYRNHYEDAIKYINEGVLKGANRSYAKLLLGKIYYYGYKDYDKALLNFNMAYNDFSNDSYLLKMLALTHKALGQNQDAKNYYQRYIKSLKDLGADEDLIKKAEEEEASIPSS